MIAEDDEDYELLVIPEPATSRMVEPAVLDVPLTESAEESSDEAELVPIAQGDQPAAGGHGDTDEV